MSKRRTLKATLNGRAHVSDKQFGTPVEMFRVCVEDEQIRLQNKGLPLDIDTSEPSY
jgi:hypothetical protein